MRCVLNPSVGENREIDFAVVSSKRFPGLDKLKNVFLGRDA